MFYLRNYNFCSTSLYAKISGDKNIHLLIERTNVLPLPQGENASMLNKTHLMYII